MAKVLKTVAVIAVAVAVVVFAPQIAAVLASVAGSLGVTVAATALSSALIGMGISMALAATAMLFRKAPSMSQSLADRLNTSVVPTASRKIVFGTTAGGQDVRFFEGDVDLPSSKIDGYVQVIALASHRISAFRDFYTENDLVWSNGTFLKHRGGFAPNNPFRVVLEGKPGNSFSVGSGRYWNSTSTFTGCAYYVPFWKLDEKVWESGIPQRLTAIVDGCPIYDPRRDSTRGGSGSHRIDNQDTWGFRDGSVEYGRNPALALLTYLIGWRINGKVVWGMGIPAHRIDFDNFRAYANVCEERVATQGGGTVQRYHLDGIFSTTDSHETIINGITAAMGSCKMTDRGGTYCLVGGYDDTAGPKIAFDADDLVAPSNGASPYIWNPAPPSRERFNIVRGRFANPDELYQLTDWGDPIEREPLADNIPRTLTLDLGGVSRPETCQRIAKQFLLREYLCPGKFSATFGPKAFAVEIGDVITLSLPAEGWNNKMFRVEEQAESHDMFFQMVLREEDPAIYAWDREEKPLPLSLRPQGYDASTTITPSNLQLTSASYPGSNGVNISEVHVTWMPEMSGRVGSIQIQSRPQGTTAWTEQAAAFDHTLGKFTFTANAPGITVEVQARFRMSSAVYSPWATANVATAAVAISYDDVKDTPSTLSEINPTQGTKLDGIQAGATVGGVIGSNIMNPDGSIFVPSAGGQASDTTPPATPTGLTMTSTLTDAGTTLRATWTGVNDSDLAGYVIALKEGAGNYIEFVGGLTTSFERTALPRNTAFTAKVAAYDRAGNRSAFTSEVTLTTARDTTPPGQFTIDSVETSYESAFVTVTAPTDSDVDRLQLDLYRNNDLVGNQTVKVSPGQKTIVTLPKLLKATTYQVGGFAYDTSGNGSAGVPSVEFTTAGGVAASDFSPGLEPIRTVSSLPTSSGYSGPAVVFYNGDLYRFTGSTWTKSLDYSDVTGANKPDDNATVGAPAGTKVGDTPATTIESRANSPAARINEDTVTINGGKITAKSLGAAQIAAASITANEMQTGTLTAAQMATSSLTASVVAVGNPDNVIGDSDFRDPRWWSGGNADGRITVGDTGMAENRREILVSPGGGIDVTSMFFPVDPGATYRITYGVYTYSNFSGKFRPIIHVPGVLWMSMKANGVGMSPSDEAEPYNYTVANRYSQNSFVFTNPGGPDQGRWQFRIAGGWTGQCAFTVKIVRVSDTTLIKDGAVTTDKIIVGTLNGDRLLAGSIEADKLQASSITTKQLAVGLRSNTLRNILNTSFWGTGDMNATPNWNSNNAGANSWFIGQSPTGGAEPLLRMLANTNDANGGWNTFVRQEEGFSPNKAYRYYTWYWAESGDNLFYHGTDNVQMLSGGDVGNPYFFSGAKQGFQFGRWYLFVGVVQPAGSAQPDSGMSGAWDSITGRRILTGSDYRWRPGAAHGNFRSYQYYGNVGGVSYFTKPVVEEIVAGQTASLQSLMQQLDYAQNINGGSTLIAPGKVLIQGGTSLDSWRDQTEIRGGAIKANTVTAEKVAINARGISALGLDFRYQDGRLHWSDGHVLYTDDNGNAAAPYIPGGSVAWAGGSYNYILWDKGAGGFRHVVDAWEQSQNRNANSVIMVTWRGGSNFVANYGGTIVSGDRIVTRSINASQIQAGTIGAYEIAANSITADRLNVTSLSALSANIGLLRTASSGARQEIEGNQTRVYDSNGTLRVRFGVC